MSSGTGADGPGARALPAQPGNSGAGPAGGTAAQHAGGPAGSASAGPAWWVSEGRRVAGRGSRRWLTAAAAVVVVAAGAGAAGVSGAFGTPGQPAAGSSGQRTGTQLVTRGSLTSQTQVNATLGDAGSWSVVVPPTGSCRGCGPPASGSCSSFFLNEHQSVLGNVADGLLYAGAGAAERRERAAAALARVGLGGRLAAKPTQLSGGERQRVAIARAVAGQPAIVLADEPTGNLDSSTGQSVLTLLEDLHAAGATIVVITHDTAIAARMPRQLQMLDGRIVSDTAHAASPGHAGPAQRNAQPAAGRLPHPRPGGLS